jgi:hypothetical protein
MIPPSVEQAPHPPAFRIRLLNIVGLAATGVVVLLGLWPSPNTLLAALVLPSIPINLWSFVTPDVFRRHRLVRTYVLVCICAAPLAVAWMFLGPMFE